MKTLGRSECGGFIVEMSLYEHNGFQLLREAAEGLGFDGYMGRSMQFEDKPLDVDLYQTLEAIRSWVALRFRLNDIQDDVKHLESVLSGTDEPCPEPEA